MCIHGAGLVNDAVEAAEHDLDPTDGVLTAARAVHVLEPDGDPLDVRGEFAELAPEPLTNIGLHRGVEVEPRGPDVQRRGVDRRPPGRFLCGSRDGIGKGGALREASLVHAVLLSVAETLAARCPSDLWHSSLRLAMSIPGLRRLFIVDLPARRAPRQVLGLPARRCRGSSGIGPSARPSPGHTLRDRESPAVDTTDVAATTGDSFAARSMS